MNLNKVFIVGRLTADPEVKSIGTGQRVATFSVATNRVWNDAAGQKKEATEFHNVVLWGKIADVAGQFLVKGSEVLVEGRIQTRKYEDKQGVTKYITEIVGESMQLGARPAGRSYSDKGGDKYNDEGSAKSSQSSKSSAEDIPVIELGDDGEIKPEDLPF